MDDDREVVERLLGRPPRSRFEVVVRRNDGTPRVIRNEPLLLDGTPMPTRYWLVDPDDRRVVGHLEAAGGVRRAEGTVDAEALRAAHDRYAAERDGAVPPDHDGPAPFGGVGGTRRGVKCLHAHYAWHLAGGDDPVGAWVAAELAAGQDPGVTAETLAAIDCGTNSTRLLVSRDGETVERLMTITRLGQDVDETGVLAHEAIARTVAALTEYRQVMDRHGVDRVRATATSAARDASNRDQFFDRAEAAIGARPELLGGEEEGRLSFDGATAELDPSDGPFLVADIGGGSTELAVGSEQCEAARSIDVGCVRMTEQFLHHDPPRPEELTAVLSLVQSWLDEVVHEIPSMRDATSFVGLAGTVATVAAVEIGLPEYDRDQIHHFVLTRDAVEDVFRTLATEAADDRRWNPGLEPGRVDIIVGGCCVLVAIMRYFDFDECLVSEADILDGLVASLADLG